MDRIPPSISRQHLLDAIDALEGGDPHAFGKSTGYDVLFKGKRYPPKAVVGIAAGRATGSMLGPYDFKGGLGSKCFRLLIRHGFSIVTKGDTNPFPEEVEEADMPLEGAVLRILVNSYERDAAARKAAIARHGCSCKVCNFDFEAKYGAIGEGYSHVHHLVPLSQLRKTYRVDPAKDLVPVCPNCHAMLHKRTPPFTVVELREMLRS